MTASLRLYREGWQAQKDWAVSAAITDVHDSSRASRWLPSVQRSRKTTVMCTQGSEASRLCQLFGQSYG